MKITTHIDTEKSLRTHIVEGRVDSQTLLDSLKAFYMSAEYDQDMNALWDLRNATSASIKSVDVKALSSLIRTFWGRSEKSRSALVVKGDLEFGFSRMLELNVTADTNSQMRVFRDIEKAHTWLARV